MTTSYSHRILCSSPIPALLIFVFTATVFSTSLHAQFGPGNLSNFVENALSPLEGKMEERAEVHEEASQVFTLTEPPAPDPAMQRVIDDLMSEMMVKQKGAWFSQYLGSGIPVPVQFQSFEISGPFARGVTEEEKTMGIIEKFTYELNASSHRHFRKPDGWGPWKPGNPIYFDDITVVKISGRWEIRESPAKSYSLLRKR